MLSPQGQRIKAWLFQNVKNGPAAASIEEARARVEAFSNRVSLSDDIKIDPVEVGNISGEWVRYGNVYNDKAIMYLHGGGYITGSGRSSRGLSINLSRVSRCPVLAVDYRLAPEYPFPSALEDAVAAYQWLKEQGILPQNIVIIGDSAGGGLTLATLLSLRDAGAALPAAGVLISPWLDLLDTGESRTAKADSDPWFNPNSIENDAAQFYAGQNDMENPLISPLYADLHNLPPLLVHAGTDDILLDDSTQLYEKGSKTGADITLEVWEGMWHVWHHFAVNVPEAEEAVKRIGEYIQNKLGITDAP